MTPWLWMAVCFLASSFANAVDPNPVSSTPRPTTNDVAMIGADASYRLTVGDRVTVRLVEDQEEPKAVMITDAGEVEIPYVGRMAAEGRTCQEVSAAAKAKLEEKYYHKVTVVVSVDLRSKTQGKVYLAGQVRVPGFQEIPSDEVFTVSKAVLRAGGFADFADKRRVKLTRKHDPSLKEGETLVIDLHEILEKGKTAKDVRLRPDDVIFVPERGVNF